MAASLLSSSSSLSSIDSSLDELFIDFFTSFSSYRVHRSQLSLRMSAGFFSFIETRFAQPNISLDQSSYIGRPMSAEIGISLNKTGAGSLIKLNNSKFVEDEIEDENSAESKTISSKIRQRVFTAHLSEREQKLDKLIEAANQRGKGLKSNDDSEDDSDSEKIDDIDAPELDLRFSPLLWFGVLTPPKLRQAQREFVAALTDIAAIAAIQIKLNLLAEKFEELMEKKNQLKQNKNVSSVNTNNNTTINENEESSLITEVIKFNIS